MTFTPPKVGGSPPDTHHHAHGREGRGVGGPVGGARPDTGLAPPTPALAPSDPVAAGLARVWRRARPVLLARVTAIERAVAALGKGPAGRATVEAGHAEAHRLTGVLGTFGLERGTELARQLERGLSEPGAGEAAALERLAATLRKLVECANPGHATDTRTSAAPPPRPGR